MAKTKYVARKTVAKKNLLSADGTRRLTIALKEGSGKFNVAASIRSTDEEEDFETQSGARASFTSVEEGTKAVDALSADAQKKGWKLEATAMRGSFTTIPEAPGAKKVKK